jgi:hypothetical protein
VHDTGNTAFLQHPGKILFSQWLAAEQKQLKKKAEADDRYKADTPFVLRERSPLAVGEEGWPAAAKET